MSIPPRSPLPVEAKAVEIPLYAIGDLHGRHDLLVKLLGLIQADSESLGVDDFQLVFVGDYVDRGPASRQIIDHLIGLKAKGGDRVITLRGNHDQYMIEFVKSSSTGEVWMRYGGAATLTSYGVTPPRGALDPAGWEALAAKFRAAVPDEHLNFIKAAPLKAKIGDYLFVHAGVRPGVAIDAQDPRDLMSIRGDFLHVDHPAPGATVVFGHTPAATPTISPGKIGIDTGGYATGVLTALRLWRDRQDFIQTGQARPPG